MMQPPLPRAIQNAAVRLVGTTRPATRLSRSTSSNRGTSMSLNAPLPRLPPTPLSSTVGAPSAATVASRAASTAAS